MNETPSTQLGAAWDRIVALKQAPCRICRDPASNGSVHSLIKFHRIVSPDDGGMDVPDNIVPLCEACKLCLDDGMHITAYLLLDSLTPAERAYMVIAGGPDYAERHYGVSVTR